MAYGGRGCVKALAKCIKARHESRTYDDAFPTNPNADGMLNSSGCERRGAKMSSVAQRLRTPVGQHRSRGSQDDCLVVARMQMLKGHRCQDGGLKQESSI